MGAKGSTANTAATGMQDITLAAFSPSKLVNRTLRRESTAKKYNRWKVILRAQCGRSKVNENSGSVNACWHTLTSLSPTPLTFKNIPLRKLNSMTFKIKHSTYQACLLNFGSEAKDFVFFSSLPMYYTGISALLAIFCKGLSPLIPNVIKCNIFRAQHIYASCMLYIEKGIRFMACLFSDSDESKRNI